MSKAARIDVLIDVCTQEEYLGVNALHRCVNAEHIHPHIRRLMAFARWAHAPIVSCVDTRRRNQIGDTFLCEETRRAPVRQKVSPTVMPNHVVVHCDNHPCVALDILDQYQQAIFTKDHRDPFTNPKLDRMLTEAPFGRCAVFGVSLENSVRILILGLLRRERKVCLVHDACGYFNAQEAEMVLRQLTVKGCEVISTEDYIAREAARRTGTTRPRPRRSVA